MIDNDFLYFVIGGKWESVDYVGYRNGKPISYEDAVTWCCSIMRYSDMPEGTWQMWESNTAMNQARPVGWGSAGEPFALEDAQVSKLKDAYSNAFSKDASTLNL